MLDSSLEQIISRMAAWRGKPLSATLLGGGLTNRNYRVDVDGEAFVVRIGARDTELLGINREHEYACSVIASEVGAAPEVLGFFPDLGSMVTRFVAGRKIPPGEMRTRQNIHRVAQTVRTLHGTRAFPSAWSPFDMIDAYRRTAERLGCPLPADAGDIFAQAAQIERALYAGCEPPRVPCHNDLLNENFLDDGAIRIIDYEYAAMGDPFFDLANFSSHHRFGDEQDAWLLEAYFGEASDEPPPDDAFARLQLMKLVSDLREAMWGVVQIRLSKLQFDYQAYANEWFERYREKRAEAYRRRLLASVAEP